MQTQGHAGGRSRLASCPCKKGPTNQILKVKSHIRIQGNKETDKLATAATDSSKCSQEYAIGHEGLQGLYWPVQTVEKMSNGGNDAAAKTSHQPSRKPSAQNAKQAMQTLPVCGSMEPS